MKAIAIGSSSGGPKALTEVIKNLPADLDAVVIILQHLPLTFTKSMSERLNEISPIKVSQVLNGETLEGSHVYVVPEGFNFFITSPNMQAYLLKATSLNKPSINMGFASMAETFGPELTGVILTGMGEDGTIGSKLIKNFGGTIIAQDEESSEIFGMPKSIQDSGLADEILPLKKIAPRLVESVNAH
jgi:two-component system, chemotaxis family, protein-glutamate methylesterase/glutaminase